MAYVLDPKNKNDLTIGVRQRKLVYALIKWFGSEPMLLKETKKMSEGIKTMKCAECPCLVYGCIYRFNGEICPYGVDNRLIKKKKEKEAKPC